MLIIDYTYDAFNVSMCISKETLSKRQTLSNIKIFFLDYHVRRITMATENEKLVACATAKVEQPNSTKTVVKDHHWVNQGQTRMDRLISSPAGVLRESRISLVRVIENMREFPVVANRFPMQRYCQIAVSSKSSQRNIVDRSRNSFLN